MTIFYIIQTPIYNFQKLSYRHVNIFVRGKNVNKENNYNIYEDCILVNEKVSGYCGLIFQF